MSLEELQAFLRFVIKCEGNRKDIPDLDVLETPIWWPNDFEFSETVLMKQEKNRGKLSMLLKKAIRSCYNFHECAFLIEFCRKLLDYTGGVANLQVINNGDGTRSLIKRKDKKLLVTFKAENQDYDKEYKRPGKKMSGSSESKFSISSPMKKKETRRLLANLPAVTTSDPAMSKCLAELYLCDYCDITFDSLPKLIAHEKKCRPKPDIEEPTETTIKDKRKQIQLLKYLKLIDVKKTSAKKQLKEDERPRANSYEKYLDIDVSSPLGIYIIQGSRLTLDQQHPASRSMRGHMSAEDYNNQLEAKCPGTIPAMRGSNAYADIRTKFPNVYRGSKRKPGSYVHIYSFNKKQRLDRLRDLKRGLTPHSFRLWRRTNKKESGVKLRKIGAELTQFYMAKYRERMARWAAQQEQEEDQDTDSEMASNKSFSQPLHIKTPSLTPDSTPSHSPRLTAVRSHHHNHVTSSRQSSPGSAITIETSDSDAEMQDPEDANHRVRILVKPPPPLPRHHYFVPSPSSSHQQNLQKSSSSPLISVKLIEPLDEFEPTSPIKEMERLPLSVHNMTAINPSSRFVPAPTGPVTAHLLKQQTARKSGSSRPPGPSPANRVQKTKSHHIPNILLKSRQSEIVSRQLTVAASMDRDSDIESIKFDSTPENSAPPSPTISAHSHLAALGLEATKSKVVAVQKSYPSPRAQMLTQGRQQSPLVHHRKPQTPQPLSTASQNKQLLTTTQKSILPNQNELFVARKSRPMDVECVDLSSGEE